MGTRSNSEITTLITCKVASSLNVHIFTPASNIICSFTFRNRIFQALVLILFGVCTTLDGNSILKLEGENGTKRVIIPGGQNPMMGSYGSKCEVD